jgi:flagellar assembly factor FliW
MTDTLTGPGTITITFADGLPGFEAQREYILMTSRDLEPFAHLRGLGLDAPSFLAIDPRRVVADYRRDLSEADRVRLEANEGAALLWLALVRPRDSGATVNLRAPIVINPSAMRGLQLVDADDSYPLDHPLTGR